MEPIKFYIGQESGIVVEKDNFASSIFAEQYKQTFEIFNNIWESQEKEELRNASNIIAFCGDRGEGKTSLLTSCKEIISNDDIFKKAISHISINSDNINPSKIEALDLIDPAFFDGKHNLIELVLGQMYGKLEYEIKKDKEFQSDNFCKRKPLMQKFQQAKACLSALEQDIKEQYDEMSELSTLGASVYLKNALNDLFKEYLKYYNKKKLLISIDDLDLNIEGGYKMVEEIRKYLSTDDCIILLAVKVNQLERIVMSYMKDKLQHEEFVSDEAIRDMAKQYVTKLLPFANRVLMPQGVEIAEKEFVLMKTKDEPLSKQIIIKDFIVRLIFQKTRYVFVNTRSLCPIVPTNLRALRLLIAKLWNLHDAEKDNQIINGNNQSIFKQYFYYSWINCLSKKNQKALIEVVEHSDILSINKKVVSLLSNQLNLQESVDDEKDMHAQLIKSIINPVNNYLHVSIGDVYYIIHQVEQFCTNEETLKMLFFIKTFYSIKLYELYDVISSNEHFLTPLPEDNIVTLYKLDDQVCKTNQLQRLVNGSYFTYLPSDILPNEKRSKAPRDKRIINAKDLQKLFSDLVKSNGKPNAKVTLTTIQKLNLCEFFALTTTIDVRKEDFSQIFDRTTSEPTYLKIHDTTNSYLVFDVLSIFYNLINLKSSYQRFNNFCGKEIDFYEFAYNNESSLLRRMLKQCAKIEQALGHALKPDTHGLLSESVIRISEIQQSINEMCISNRDFHKQGENRKNIYMLYQDIQKIGIRLYALLDEDDKDVYKFKFKFLVPIIEFLKNEINDNQFDYIFSSEESYFAQGDVATDDDIKNLDSVFGQALKDISIKFPQKGDAILASIAQEFSHIYNNLGGKMFWDAHIIAKEVYDLETLYNLLSPYTQNIVKAQHAYVQTKERQKQKEDEDKKQKIEQEKQRREDAARKREDDRRLKLELDHRKRIDDAKKREEIREHQLKMQKLKMDEAAKKRKEENDQRIVELKIKEDSKVAQKQAMAVSLNKTLIEQLKKDIENMFDKKMDERMKNVLTYRD